MKKENLPDIYQLYKEVEELNEFTHVHFYPLKTVGSIKFGIAPHKWMKIVGFNSSDMTYRVIRNGSTDDVRPGHIKTLSGYEKAKLDINQMGFWHDGSFFIKGNFKLDYEGQTTNFI